MILGDRRGVRRAVRDMLVADTARKESGVRITMKTCGMHEESDAKHCCGRRATYWQHHQSAGEDHYVRRQDCCKRRSERCTPMSFQTSVGALSL